ncbi:MAG: ribonuclease H [Dehalococcoidaceae bacterium]|nr:ribonuclease H [Dehalococcoidaceae bacterium]|tara:strand:- start:7781 stop:8275 length:495 start_codon:yes stop_codon:yes gene_type:complete
MKKQRTLLTLNQVLEKYVDGPSTGIFTDGSCSGNPGPGGWGVVVVDNNQIIDQKFGNDEHTTNNKMELTALLEAMKYAQKIKVSNIYTDSQLLVKTFTLWAMQWEKMNWRRKSGPIKNLELIKEIYFLFNQQNEYTLNWIPAHSGFKWNEYADALSTAYLREIL